LVLEAKPCPREQLAALLWEHKAARQNLRVELTRLRSSGLDFSGAQTPTLSLNHLPTDLEQFENQHPQNEAELIELLELLRGPPLSELAGVGSPAFKVWAERRVVGILERLQLRLEALYLILRRQDWTTAELLWLEKVDLLGLERSKRGVLVPAAPWTQGHSLHFTRPEEESRLRVALENALYHPVLGVLRGAAGSGKSHLAEWLARQTLVQTRAPPLTLRATASRSVRLTLASVATQLTPHVQGAARESLNHIRARPGNLESDLVRLSAVLEQVHRPLLLIFDHAQVAQAEFATALEFWLNNLPSGLFLVLSREDEHPSEGVRSLLRRVDPSRRLELTLGALSLMGVAEGLAQQGGGSGSGVLEESRLAYAHSLLQRSDGNVQHMLALLEQEQHSLTPSSPAHALEELYLGEAGDWPEEVYTALRYLSVVHTTFDEPLACALLERMGLEAPARLLAQALERGVLQAVPPERALVFPFWTPLSRSRGRTSSEVGEGAGEGATPPFQLQNQAHREERFEFRREALRIALATSLPQPTRQELRRHLGELLAPTLPGLAAYYARRTGQLERATLLLEQHLNTLPSDSPLGKAIPRPVLRTPASAQPPTPLRSSAYTPPLRELGYHVALDEGWLNLRRRGRYGPAETLCLLFPLPSGLETPKEAEGTLRLIWRLDVFNSGQDLFPIQVPFALRLHLRNTSSAQVFNPETFDPYFEDGLEHRIARDVHLEGWMEHTLSLSAPPEGGLLELCARALDVALVVGLLEWNGQNLLGKAVTPQRTTA